MQLPPTNVGLQMKLALHRHAIPLDLPSPLRVGQVKHDPLFKMICVARLHVVFVQRPPVALPTQNRGLMQPQEVVVAAYPFDWGIDEQRIQFEPILIDLIGSQMHNLELG